VVVSRYLLKLYVLAAALSLYPSLIQPQLTSSTRYAESRNAYREVQQRQQDLMQMENTLTELAQLFIDVPNIPYYVLRVSHDYFQMGALVEQHEPIINRVHDTAIEVESDMVKGFVTSLAHCVWRLLTTETQVEA
jgi:t-SNARE complex subunit (syntaxin)